MNDINFFEPYLDNKKQWKDINKIIPIVIVLIMLVASSFYYFSLLNEKSVLEDEISSIEQLISEPERQAKYNEALESKAVNETVKSMHDEVSKVAADIKSSFKIDKLAIEEILNQAPENTFVETVSIKDGYIDLTCVSDKYESVAQYLHNIKNISDDIVSVFIPAIRENDGDFYYSINIKKGGETDEND